MVFSPLFYSKILKVVVSLSCQIVLDIQLMIKLEREGMGNKKKFAWLLGNHTYFLILPVNQEAIEDVVITHPDFSFSNVADVLLEAHLEKPASNRK